MAVSPADLASIPLFSSLGPEAVDELATWFESKTASEGVKICGEGAPGYSFFVIVDGNAVVSSEGTELATLGPGDFFGEVAILDGGRRTATVTTTTPAKLLVLFGTEFRQLQEAHPAVAAQLEEAVATRTAPPASQS
jgi:CRP/FNR family transcriptional regulator, cyclic AMP receptor protein